MMSLNSNSSRQLIPIRYQSKVVISKLSECRSEAGEA